jgi:hypothetical protein
MMSSSKNVLIFILSVFIILSIHWLVRLSLIFDFLNLQTAIFHFINLPPTPLDFTIHVNLK